MQMIFSGAGIGGCQMMASNAKSGEWRAASSASFFSAPAAVTSRSVGYSFANRAERSTTPLSVTAPYLIDPSTEKVARRGDDIDSDPFRMSSPANAGDPVIGGVAFQLRSPRNTGSPGQAGQ